MCLFPHLDQWKAESTPVGHQRRLHLQSADQCAVLPGSEAGVLGFHLRPAPCPGCAVSREIGREKAHLSECAGGPGRTYQKVPLRTDKTGVSSGAGAGQGPSCTWLASWAALRRSVGRTFPSAAFSCRDLELRKPSSPSGGPPTASIPATPPPAAAGVCVGAWLSELEPPGGGPNMPRGAVAGPPRALPRVCSSKPRLRSACPSPPSGPASEISALRSYDQLHFPFLCWAKCPRKNGNVASHRRGTLASFSR